MIEGVSPNPLSKKFNEQGAAPSQNISCPYIAVAGRTFTLFVQGLGFCPWHGRKGRRKRGMEERTEGATGRKKERTEKERKINEFPF